MILSVGSTREHSTLQAFTQKRVAIFGCGNAGMEAASSISKTAAHVDVWCREVRLAWQTHYPGAVRTGNSGVIDQYQLKSLDSLIVGMDDIPQHSIVKVGEELHVLDPPNTQGVSHPRDHKLPKALNKYKTVYESYQASYPKCRNFEGCYAYDAVIRALGWHFDTGLFGEATRPALVGENSAVGQPSSLSYSKKTKRMKEERRMMKADGDEDDGENNPGGAARINGKYPAMTPHYESVNVPGLFFAGALGHSLDYKKAAGGFIHGFRYTAQALVRDLLRRFHGRPWKVRNLKDSVEAVVNAVIARLRSSSSMWQMYGVIGDVILVSHATMEDEDDVATASSSSSSSSGSGSSGSAINFKYVEDVPIAMLKTPEFVASLLQAESEGEDEVKASSASSSLPPVSYVTVVFEWGAASYGPQILNEPGGLNKFLHPVMRLHGPIAQLVCKSSRRATREGNSFSHSMGGQRAIESMMMSGQESTSASMLPEDMMMGTGPGYMPKDMIMDTGPGYMPEGTGSGAANDEENCGFWPGGIECGFEDGHGDVTFEFGDSNLFKNFKNKNKWGRRRKGAPVVAESHLAEDLQTEFMHPKFHVGRVLELFAEIEEAAAEAANTTNTTSTKRKKQPVQHKF